MFGGVDGGGIGIVKEIRRRRYVLHDVQSERDLSQADQERSVERQELAMGDDRAGLHAQARREGYRLIRSLLKSLLILAVFVPFATALPVAALWLCRTPDGAQFLFWTGPWSCCFWVLIYSQLSASKFWLGAEHVRQWREANGGLLHTSIRATGWMFGALFFSYARRVPDALPCSSLAVRQSAAPGLHLLALVFRMVLEEVAWMTCRAAR